MFQLAGEPFSISVVANAASVPKTHGPQWAVYVGLKMTGTVHSRLLPTPVPIANDATSIALATGNPNLDIFKLGSPIRAASLTIHITADVAMPKGTIPNAHVHPFAAPVTMSAGNATMTYSDGTTATTLAMNGTLNATIPAAARAGVNLLVGPAELEAGVFPGRSMQNMIVGLLDSLLFQHPIRCFSTPIDLVSYNIAVASH
jgi:hypothetical protein